MTENEFIMREQDKMDEVFLDDMARIEKFGFLRSKYKTDTYLINDLITLSPPRPNFPYNHYRLTEAGNKQVFAALARRGCFELIVPRGKSCKSKSSKTAK